jgi:pyridoxine/pyridoxamine 5'-phosphate oxidase
MSNDDKIANPPRFYNSPNEIDEDVTLTTNEKIKSLENWLDDIINKHIAEGESMVATTVNAPDYTLDIQKMLRRLSEDSK